MSPSTARPRPPVASAPYTQAYTLPRGISTLTVAATATDGIGKTGTAMRTFEVIPDVPTTIVGSVTDEAGQPVAGATVTVFGEYSASSGDVRIFVGYWDDTQFSVEIDAVVIDGATVQTFPRVGPSGGGVD